MASTEVTKIDRALSLPQEVALIRITDQLSLDNASIFLTHTVLAMEKEIIATFEPIKKKTRAAWQEAVDQEKRHLEPVQKAKGILKSAMASYMEELERRRQEEQRRLEAEAEQKAFTEQQERIALERELGASEAEVEAIAAEPIIPEQVAAPKIEASTAGMRKVRKAKVTSKIALIRYVAEHPEQAYLLDVNVSFLNSLAKSDVEIPGVEFYTETQIAARRSA